jgi:hypothetical protein
MGTSSCRIVRSRRLQAHRRKRSCRRMSPALAVPDQAIEGGEMDAVAVDHVEGFGAREGAPASGAQIPRHALAEEPVPPVFYLAPIRATGLPPVTVCRPVPN